MSQQLKHAVSEAVSELLRHHQRHSLLAVKAHMISHSAASPLQIPQAIMVLLDPELQRDRLYSKNLLSWRLVTTTAGYFAYDLYVHTVRFEFLPSLVHAGAALTVFLSGIYCGILHYYGAHPSLTHCLSLTSSTRTLEELVCWAPACFVPYSLWYVSLFVRLKGLQAYTPSHPAWRPRLQEASGLPPPAGKACRLGAETQMRAQAAVSRDAALDPAHCMLQAACSCCGSAARPSCLCAGGSTHWGEPTPSCTCTMASP